MAKITWNDKVATRLLPTLPIENKVTDEDLNEVKKSVNALYDHTGWINYVDGQYNALNKRTLTAGNRSLLSIDGGGGITDAQAPVVVASNPEQKIELWNTAKNNITTQNSGDALLCRLSFEAEIANANGYYKIEYDIGGSVGVIAQRTEIFPKGAGVGHSFCETDFLFTLGTFATNGCSIYITPSHEMKIWDAEILLGRVHRAR